MPNCPVCRSDDKEGLHRQLFVFPELAAPTHYDVAHCRSCGFVFAENLPAQIQHEYYSEAVHHLHTALPDGLAAIHARFFEFIAARLPSIHDEGVSVLDVGSAMGHFLARFKAAGIRQITGLDPNPQARTLARQHYGIDVRTGTIDHFTHERPFGLITLCGVLEHIDDLHRGLTRIGALLDTGGHVFIAVPDAGSFGLQTPAEPFLEFAAEHIRFFTRNTLENLFAQHGFEMLACQSQRNTFYGNSYLLALFGRTGAATARSSAYDPAGRASILRYIDSSTAALARTASLIAELAAGQQPLVVWGAGSLSARLCATTALMKTNLLAFIDRNPQLQGKRLLGVPIQPPSHLSSITGCSVLIASTTYADEIENFLLSEMRWPGRILKII